MQDPSFDILRSERLVIRRFRASDAGDFATYRSEPAVARYQGWDHPYTLAQARAFVESMHGETPGTPGAWFQFAVGIAPTGSLIGDCALRITQRDPRQAELGFTFAPAHQGRGFAGEAVTAILQYAFGTLDLHRVFAVTDVRNERANRLLERLGFRREGTFLDRCWCKGEWTSEHLYARLRREFSDGSTRAAPPPST